MNPLIVAVELTETQVGDIKPSAQKLRFLILITNSKAASLRQLKLNPAQSKRSMYPRKY